MTEEPNPDRVLDEQETRMVLEVLRAHLEMGIGPTWLCWHSPAALKNKMTLAEARRFRRTW